MLKPKEPAGLSLVEILLETATFLQNSFWSLGRPLPELVVDDPGSALFSVGLGDFFRYVAFGLHLNYWWQSIFHLCTYIGHMRRPYWQFTFSGIVTGAGLRKLRMDRSCTKHSLFDPFISYLSNTGCPKKGNDRMLLEPRCTGSITSSRHPVGLENALCSFLT